MHKIGKYLLIILLSCSTIVLAQRGKRKVVKNVDRAELETQRASLLQEIKETQLKLTELQKSKSATIEQLNALQQKLGAREALISNINKEVGYLENNIKDANQDVTVLGENLAQLKTRYAELVRYSYKKKASQNILLFLFSSTSFNDALRRYKYVKQYRDYRKGQAEKITATSEDLKSTIAELNERKMQKDQMRKSEEEQRLVIAQEEQQKNLVVQNLKGEEQRMMMQIQEKQKTAAAISSAITAAIKREIEIARKKAELERKQAADERRRIAKMKADEEKKIRDAERQAALAAKRAQDAENKRIREQEELNKRNKAIAGKNAKELVTGNGETPKANALKPRGKNNIPDIPKTEKPVVAVAPKVEPKVEPRTTTKTEPNRTVAKTNPATTGGMEPSKRIVPLQTAFDEEKKPTSNYADDLSDDVRTLSMNFEQNKGNLASPVNGYISAHFGKKKHPVYNIYEENSGVDIRTAKGSIAKSVFGGEVVSIFYIAGAGNNILVNHGNYFTLYSKIDKVSVAKGQKIGPRTPLGTVLTDNEGNTQVHFEIWKVGANNVPVKVNPEQWIRL